MRLAARNLPLFFAVVVCAALLAGGSCKRSGAPAAAPPKSPSLRVYVLSSVAGALEPCGCVKDMLGGIDHAAALVAKTQSAAPAHLVVSAGPLLFMDPSIPEDQRTQDLWKAKAIAQSVADMGLDAWTPGANDWALGADQLETLDKETKAALLAANLSGKTADAQPTRVVESGGFKVGIAGVSVPKAAGVEPDGVKSSDPVAALERAKKSLDEQGAQIRIALLSVPRGEALRLAEKVSGYQLLVVGKPFDRGHGNDGPTPPVLVGDTLVVQPPNHLQAVAVVDLFVRDQSFDFKDGSGLENSERRQSLEGRIEELTRRIAEWEKQGNVKAADLKARKADLERMKSELMKIAAPKVPEKGSFFRYSLENVREKAGEDPAVKKRMDAYYRQVNEHNKEAFKDRLPEPVAKDLSGYVGVEVCSSCHTKERAFWNKTRHAGAYATLVKQYKEYNLECVDCHVTGYDKPGGSTVTHTDKLQNVQCEVCHGPGSRHVDDPKNPELIRAAPDKSLCAGTCHHPPHVMSDWSVDEAWKHIIGPGHGK
ncbi:MAG: hypothetical protein KC776_32070 [Myxococcales bacterium]|nr:hypothetical protein [Myxococcales bacterium]MCB9579139.1 hypothetical protein [Polyangiaceae bacterium]